MTESPLDELTDYLDVVDDPRVVGRCAHRLIDILTIAICAVISGADNWVEIEAYGQAKQPWLQTFLPLPHGIPSHDTFGRVFARIAPEQFREGFMRWVVDLYARLVGAEESIAIDGKTLRRSHDRINGGQPLHLVSAWATQSRLVLGQIATEEKSNEITAIPQLLAMLDLKDSVISIDAMGCQRDITEQVKKGKGDYLLQVKGNQPTLYQRLKNLFVRAYEEGGLPVAHETARSIGKGHGRIEQRRCWVVTDEDWLRYLQRDGTKERWIGLKAVVKVERKRRIGETVSVEEAYYITSLEGEAKRILTLIRGHWGIENSLHWVLDMAFREDESRVRIGHAAENLAILRHMAMNLLKQEQTLKIGIHAKRLRCGCDLDYLRRVLSV